LEVVTVFQKDDLTADPMDNMMVGPKVALMVDKLAVLMV
jgi:hypothetical protein